MGFPDIWLSIISRCVCESVSKDICIWIGRLSKVDCCTQDGWAVNRPIRWRKERCALPSWWSWGTHLCLPFSLLVLRPSNYTTSFPRSLACRRQMVGLPSLHNFMGQCLIINFHIYVCVCVCVCTHTLFYCAPLYCSSQVLSVLHSEGLWQTCVVRWWLAFIRNKVIFT